MKSLLSFSLLLVIISSKCFTQDGERFLVSDITKATFLSPGISYEKVVGKLQSIYGQAALSTSFYFFSSSAQGTTAGIDFVPSVKVQYRHYYNYTRRQAKGKRTEMNSLNYIGPAFETYFSKNRILSSHYPEDNPRLIYTIGAIWGLQRNYEKRFSVDFNFGPGYLFTRITEPGPDDKPIEKSFGTFTTLGQFTLGFWLNKRKF